MVPFKKRYKSIAAFASYHPVESSSLPSYKHDKKYFRPKHYYLQKSKWNWKLERKRIYLSSALLRLFLPDTRNNNFQSLFQRTLRYKNRLDNNELTKHFDDRQNLTTDLRVAIMKNNINNTRFYEGIRICKVKTWATNSLNS